MLYGLPYMGSKSDIAKQIVDILPTADTLVDLFAGGCAITHAALLSGKWKRIIANDITDAPQLFLDAIHGKYHDCDRWVSREEFYMLKDKDAFVRLCWSFGNNQSNYMYSREFEPYKKAIHGCVFGKNIRSRYLSYRRAICLLQDLLKLYSIHAIKNLQSLESLERLQSLESLERLQSLESLEILQKDYKEIHPPINAIVYCDPPYKNTASYLHDFDSIAFENWCKRQTVPLFISEYNLPYGECIAEWQRASSLSSVATNQTTERLYALNWSKPKGVLMKQMELFAEEAK